MNINQIAASAGFTFAYWSLDSTLERFLWSIDRLSELGYKQYTLEILEPPHVAIYQDNENIAQLLDKGRERGVKFYNFMPYHCCTNLTSASRARRKLGVRQFEEGAKIAQEMGISVLSIASDWPPEWVSSYSAEYAHAPAAEFQVPSSQEYGHIWTGHVEAISECLEIALKYKMQLGLEPRANCLVSGVDSFLRMWDRLRSDDFFCSLDVMHSAYHRENVPVAIKKLGSRLGEVQICGADGRTLRHLPLVDDAAIRKTLKALEEEGFTGTLCVELYGMPSEEIDAGYRQAREILERQIAALNS
jgi:sugar phosphate isomerase/epimerase